MLTSILPEWDLKDFYKSNDSKEFQDEIKNLETNVLKFSKKNKGKISKLPISFIDKVIAEYENIEEIIVKIKSYIFLFHCTDQLNESKTQFYQKTQEKLTKIESNLIFFNLEINKLKVNKLDDLSKSHYYPWLKIQRQFRKYQKSEFTEKLLLEKSSTSSNSWIRLFDQTMAGLAFKMNGKSLNESQILNLMSSKSSKTRKSSSKIFGETLKKNIKLLSLITNTLSKDLIINNNIRGFKNCDSFRHLSNQVASKDVDCLVQTVKKNYSSLSHRYYKYKAKVFKVKKLDYWDRNAPYPNQKTEEVNWLSAKKIVINAYNEFDPKISRIVNLFFKNSWIHASIKNGKSSGAFAHPTVPSCHPYILLNYQNKIRDVMTLAHELGHGVHQYLSNRNGLLMSDTPLTLAETASVFGEMLTFKSILKNTKNNTDKKSVLRSKIEDMLNTVVRQISFYEFEKNLHNQRLSGELSIDNINKIWLTSQKNSLGSSIKLSDNYKYFWSYIPHFIHSPFYVYAYAFGDCLVNSLYAKYEEGFENFNEKFIELLKAGGSKDYREILGTFELNPEDPSFWQSGLNLIKKLIDELEDLG